MDATAQQMRQALRPLASLLSKSEKAQGKVAPGTWQYEMLAGNIEALRVALALMDPTNDTGVAPSQDELAAALTALDALVGRVEDTEARFAVGTPQHTLQRNRLAALRIARATVEAGLERR